MSVNRIGNGIVKAPFGPADIQTPTFASTIELTIENSVTVVQLTVTAAVTFSLATITQGFAHNAGDTITFTLVDDGSASTVTWGTGLTAVASALVASKTLNVTFIYDGANYVANSSIQID